MSFTGSLARELGQRKRRTLERARRAAVLVPLVDDGGPERIILTRRSDDLASHQGQVAFPGGYVESSDDGPVATALREAREEIGLPPESAEVLGLLDDFTTWDGRVAVTSVAARLASVPPLTAQASEVARIFEIGLAELSRPEFWISRPNPGGKSAPRLFYFDHDGETLWGLSARIVIHILELTGRPSPRLSPS